MVYAEPVPKMDALRFCVAAATHSHRGMGGQQPWEDGWAAAMGRWMGSSHAGMGGQQPWEDGWAAAMGRWMGSSHAGMGGQQPWGASAGRQAAATPQLLHSLLDCARESCKGEPKRLERAGLPMPPLERAPAPKPSCQVERVREWMRK
eukprot:351557-Chlamydomonas_euryale.AAC.6